jgi:iron complex outermembrane receptor protein
MLGFLCSQIKTMNTLYPSKLKKISGIISFLLFSFIYSSAQTGELKGWIHTSDHKPAASVNVQLKELKKGVVSAPDGSYQFTNLKEGRYTVIVSFAELQTIEKSVEIKAGETITTDFVLQENANELNEVIVTAAKTINQKISDIGKLPVKPMDLPQSVSVIGKDVLQRQQVLQLSDALQNSTGVYIMGTTGGYQEEIAGRGLPFTSSNTFKNGVRYNNAIIPEISSVEKIEFIKGGTAILYGNVAAGGVLNIVTKKPLFENGGEISFRTGSYDFYKPSIDVYGSLNKTRTAAYRVNMSYQRAGSFRSGVSSERFYINPSFLFKLGKKTELLVEGDYLDDNRNPDFGIGAINYVIADVPRSRFLGVSWGYNKAQQGSATATVTHHFNSNWQLNGAISMQDYKAELFTAARPTTVQADGKWVRGLQKSKTNEKYYIAQVDITGKIATGKIHHTVLFGADADRYNTEAHTYVVNRYNSNSADATIRNQNIYDTINIFNPSTFNKRQDIPYLATDRITTSPINRFGIYVQDLVALSEKIKILAGVRYSYQRNERATVDTVAKGTKGSVAAYDSKAFNPRFGIVYQPVKQVSLFASYTNTFNVNTGVDSNNQALKPSIVDQFELGVKTDLLKGLLSANITLYEIINSNFAQSVIPAPLNVPAARELAGEVTSKGLEVDVATKAIHGFVFLAGYSYNETRYTKSNIYKAGERLRYNPSHTANASVFYRFGPGTLLKGLSWGVGAYYVGDRLAGRNPSTVNPNYKVIALPDYTLFDASMGYTTGKISLRVKMTNVLNKLSYNVHDDNSVNPIAPRQFAATVAYKL